MEVVDISTVTNPTPTNLEAAQAMFMPSAVLPIDGRDATITKSDGCRPSSMSSRSVRPVETPPNSPRRSIASEIRP